jgi:hypothetical protein
MRTVKGKQSKDNHKLESLRACIKAGAEALKRGEFKEIDEADLDAYLEAITTRRPL